MASMLPMLLAALTIIFFIVHLIPGDPVALSLGDHYSQEAYDQRLHQLQLDRPLVEQYANFLKDLFTGNLGNSFRTKRPIFDDLSDQFPYTIQLAIGSLAVTVLIGLPAGIVAALHRNRLLDQISMLTALLGVCAPAFWVGVVLIYIFALQLDLFPSVGAAGLEDPGGMLASLVLPSIALGAAGAALVARMTRASLLEILGQDYVRTARAKGLGDRAVLIRHAVANALLPVSTVLTLELGQLLAGSAIIEIVFSRPGVGHLLIDAVLNRDYPQIQATLAFFVLLVGLVTLLSDTLYAAIDPRVRFS